MTVVHGTVYAMLTSRHVPLPKFSPPSQMRSRNMAAIKSKDTRPERLVRRAIHKAGFRFRLHSRGLAGSPDLVLSKYHATVFVHGCFWHGHRCKVGHTPGTNSEYWRAKIQRNKTRDSRSIRTLQKSGWLTTVVKECTLERDIAALLRTLRQRRARLAKGSA